MSTPRPYSISWGDKTKTILIVNVHETFTWEIYRQSAREINTMVGTVSHPVYVIIKIEHQHNVLPPANAVKEFSRTRAEQPKNIRTRLIIDAPMLLVTTIQLFLLAVGKLAERPIHFVNSLEDAYDRIDSLKQKPDSNEESKV